jgi:hypothetical protein
MWILSLLPTSIINFALNAILVVGLIGLLLSIMVTYRFASPGPGKLVQWFSVGLLVLGIYFRGAYDSEMSWRTKVAVAEKKVEMLQAEATKENIKIVEKVVTKTMLVKEKSKDTVQFIDREVVKYDNVCVIPKEVVQAHNQAAEQVK